MATSIISPVSFPTDLEGLVDMARSVLSFLQDQTDLSPRNLSVNSCLNDFVGAVQHLHGTGDAERLEQADVRNIRQPLLEKLAKAEYEMELHWAKDYVSREVITTDDLDDFWYRQCYIDLVEEEVTAMNKVGIQPTKENKIVFVGSGPLPMTAIDMHLQTGAKIVCIDNDPEAVSLSRQMIENLGLSDNISVHQAEGDKFDCDGSDIIFVAALATQKDNIISNIRTTVPEAYVAIRSVEKGAKALLYQEIEPNAFLEQGLTYVGRSQDTHDTTFNQTMLFAPRERSAPSCALCTNPCPGRKFLIEMANG